MTRVARVADVFSSPIAPGGLRRGVVAGCLWGLTLTAGLVALRFRQCGMICVDDVAYTGVLSVAAGILTLGPLAAFGRC